MKLRHVEEPVPGARVSAIDLTVAVPDGLGVVVDALVGKRLLFVRQVGPSAWLKTRSRGWIPDAEIISYSWIERRTGLKVAHFGEFSSDIELTPYQDPTGTRVRVRLADFIGQEPIRVAVAVELDRAASDLHSRGLLVSVSPWFAQDMVAELTRAKNEKRTWKGRRA